MKGLLKMFYLVDFENVSNIGLNGIENLRKDDVIIIFYSKNANSLSFDNHKKLELTKAKKEYIEVEQVGKNALDFQLVTYLGALISKYPKEEFAIISKDQGFASVVKFWGNNDITVQMFNSISGKSTILIEEKDNTSLLNTKKIANKKIQILKNTTKRSNLKLLSEVRNHLITHSDKASQIANIIESNSTKMQINNALVKAYDSKVAGEIYKQIKPLLKTKK